MISESSLQVEVEEYCKSNHILKKDFASEIGITAVMLSHWLHGRTALSQRILERIVALLDSPTLG